MPLPMQPMPLERATFWRSLLIRPFTTPGARRGAGRRSRGCAAAAPVFAYGQRLALALCGLLVLVWAGHVHAAAEPVFSPSDPDAAAYGQGEHYPFAAPGAGGTEQRFMVGNYSHFDALFPSRIVARGTRVSELARAPDELALAYTYQGQRQSLTGYLERYPVTGLLIARDRTILFEHYRYDRTDAQRLASQSMAKTITAMLVGIAIDEGAIRSVDDRAERYVRELTGTELGATTIRALLHMASGIEFRERYDGRDDAAALARDLWGAHSPGTVRALSRFEHRVAPPGTVWRYGGLDTELLGLVLTRATGVHPADYLSNRIWRRIGAEADASWLVDASGQEATYCCVNAVLRDYARFAMLLANDGRWDDVQVIPREWVRAATRPSAPGPMPANGAAAYGYGYQVWILPGPRRQFALLGIHGQAILVDPEAKLVLVHTAVRLAPTGDRGAGELVALWNALVEQQLVEH
jgi:CubicO group peptidase (beta-lactamase class C family)